MNKRDYWVSFSGAEILQSPKKRPLRDSLKKAKECQLYGSLFNFSLVSVYTQYKIVVAEQSFLLSPKCVVQRGGEFGLIRQI